ncbi:putative ribonuclease H-like domain-containing protein [Tanacetum coccineum]
MVAQGYTQVEGIDYDEIFALVSRIEAIRLFLAYASFMRFIVYQMDVKSAFLYGTIEEEVYVCQPPGFEDPHFPDKVYKVEKALYGLHQAPRAWYETLSTYLIENGFRRGTIDKTLFIKKDKGDILLVQVYVDDIIFGSTKKSLCDEFEGLMHKRFQMSSMGELTFFLGLQVQQKKDGIFISQDKYVAEILKKFDFATVKTASTPMEPNKALVKDEEADNVDVHLYRSMIGSLMYLTASRPDIMFAVCACARFQVTPKTSHLHAVKRIFRYLKGQPKLGLWYPRDSPFDLEAFSDSDYAGASLDRKSTIRDSYEKKLIQVIKIHTDYNVVDLLTKAFDAKHIEYLIEGRLMMSICSQELMKGHATSNISVGDEAVHKELGGRMERAVTTASSLEAEQLEDASGISSLPNTEIFEQLALMGYASDSDKLTFQKDEGTSWIQEDAEIQTRTSVDTEILLDQEEPTELVEDLGSGEKGKKEISSAGVSTAKAELSTVRAELSTVIPEINEEERQRIARDAEIAKHIQEEIDIVRQEQEVEPEANQAHDIDWSDPAGGYKQSHFKGMSYEDIRLIFERVWVQNHAFVPKDSEIEKEVMKRPGFDFQQKSINKNDKIKQAGSSKKRSREDSDEDNAKKQKLEDEAKKEELKASIDIAPRDDVAIDVESLATKYLIVDWKTHVLTENMMYYQIIKADGSSKNYKIFSEMLDDFDRQDVMDLHRLVQERYDTTSLEGYDLLLWGDLKILFEPNEEDEIWKNQQDYNLISWRLFDSCGIHILLMHTGIAIHMMIEKKYPLTQEMLSRMLSRRLEVDQESEMAFKRLRINKARDTVMSDSKDSTVTYTEAPPSPDYVPGPEEPE